jgi:hypothetical protein
MGEDVSARGRGVHGGPHPKTHLVIFVHSARVSYIEENDAYVRTVASWLETGSVDVG